MVAAADVGSRCKSKTPMANFETRKFVKTATPVLSVASAMHLSRLDMSGRDLRRATNKSYA
jgi:hypothetical protein